MRERRASCGDLERFSDLHFGFGSPVKIASNDSADALHILYAIIETRVLSLAHKRI
jgi:hypothetical protein